MKKLIITRHAKSSWKDISLNDHDRPLNKRGKSDAPLMASKLKQKIHAIDKVICSTSRRTLETAKHFMESFELSDTDLETDRGLYHGSQVNYLEALSCQDDNLSTIMMIGHNPGITYMVNNAIGSSIDNVPTTGIVILESDVDKWEDLRIESSKFKDFLFPKQFK